MACFDILGFKSFISVEKDDWKAYRICQYYEKTLEYLKNNCKKYEWGHIDYCWFSDTFLMFTPDDSHQSRVVIQSAAKFFIEDCISHGIPMRGAISVGRFMRTIDHRAFIGKAFLEAFEYAEDQDWIGLILTPSAISKTRSFGLHPTRSDFVESSDIPMRKFKWQDVLAYRFQNGAANSPSRLLPVLHSMKSQSDKEHHGKYERTEQFIKEHYRWI
jgi:hypothetical protein